MHPWWLRAPSAVNIAAKNGPDGLRARVVAAKSDSRQNERHEDEPDATPRAPFHDVRRSSAKAGRRQVPVVTWMAVAAGGAIGAALRHAINTAVQARWTAGGFPLGIMFVNVLGCFAIGALAGMTAASRVHIGETARTFLVVGVLGGFTTFSAYSLDTLSLARAGQPGLAAVNAVGQVVVGLVAVWTGFALASWRP